MSTPLTASAIPSGGSSPGQPLAGRIEPCELAYVGDAAVDLLSAKAAGASGIAAQWGHLYDPSFAADLTLARPEDALALLQS